MASGRPRPDGVEYVLNERPSSCADPRLEAIAPAAQPRPDVVELELELLEGGKQGLVLAAADVLRRDEPRQAARSLPVRAARPVRTAGAVLAGMQDADPHAVVVERRERLELRPVGELARGVEDEDDPHLDCQVLLAVVRHELDADAVPVGRDHAVAHGSRHGGPGRRPHPDVDAPHHFLVPEPHGPHVVAVELEAERSGGQELGAGHRRIIAPGSWRVRAARFLGRTRT
jgi:hypothetical protein